MQKAITIFWFRRDLRLEDNCGLWHALNGKHPVLPIFIFDTEILSELPKNDARVTFIWETLTQLKATLREKYQRDIAIYYGSPLRIFKTLSTKYSIKEVITNRDYEPYALQRDSAIKAYLARQNCTFTTYKDHVIFETNKVVKKDGTPYLVFTPYSKKWKSALAQSAIRHYDTEGFLGRLLVLKEYPTVQLEEMGFSKSGQVVAAYRLSATLLKQYEATRNFPAKDSTSHLGTHLRFGTVSIRKIVAKARQADASTFLNELIWREFFIQLLWHFPYTTHRSFKPAYDAIPWREDTRAFGLWCAGKTGYALVDAGMRQLNATGFMHNRVRMVVASFLCKHLLLDWRLGEAYFAQHLHDFELASNVGNWQWVAGCGVDAAPYFRIFNPNEQLKRYDATAAYVKKWVPEWETLHYPKPIVDHAFARARCLKTYSTALQKK